MRRTRHSRVRDHSLVGMIGLLLLLGLVVIYTISPVLNYGQFEDLGSNYFLYRHMINIVVGIIAFIAASKVPLEKWKSWLPWLVGAVIITSLMLLIPATNLTINGATRWIGVGGVSFQPAELLKFVLIIYLGFLLGAKNDQEIADHKDTLVPMVALLLALGLLVAGIQRDLGTMVVVTSIIAGLLYFRGAPLSHLGILTGGLLAAGTVSVLLFPHRLSRVVTFLNPEADLQGAGYHVDQALTAIGSGGVFGLGLGRSVQVYGFLPEAENDSVFAIHGEIFGFLGAIILLVIFGVLLWRILKVAEAQRDLTARLIASGVFLWIASHILINIGAMLALIPLTGITLPFLSYGGSSLLMIMAALGMVYRMSQEQRRATNSSVVGRKL